MYGEADIACMKRLQRAMDPGDIANPGKVFAPPPDGARAGHAAERGPS